MNENSEEIGAKEPDKNSSGTLPQDDVVQHKDACATNSHEHKPKLAECDIPTKKRKTRRGKSKRRYPYSNDKKMIKPRAPYNSNQFLLEDHGDMEELDENLKAADSTTSVGRTRDSSFSVDSDGEFYSSPDDEDQYLIKDFADQYETVQAERLQSMSKDKLIQEYLILESKLDLLTKRQRKRSREEGDEPADLQQEVQRLTLENEALRRENALLKSKTCNGNAADSMDSETDSNDSCSSTTSSSGSSSCPSKPASPLVDYSQTNGHSASVETA